MSGNANTEAGQAGNSANFQILPGPPGQPGNWQGGNKGPSHNNNQSGRGGRGGKGKGGKKNQGGGQPQQGSGQGQKSQTAKGSQNPPPQQPKNKGQPPPKVFNKPEEAATLLATIKDNLETHVDVKLGSVIRDARDANLYLETWHAQTEAYDYVGKAIPIVDRRRMIMDALAEGRAAFRVTWNATFEAADVDAYLRPPPPKESSDERIRDIYGVVNASQMTGLASLDILRALKPPVDYKGDIEYLSGKLDRLEGEMREHRRLLCTALDLTFVDPFPPSPKASPSPEPPPVLVTKPDKRKAQEPPSEAGQAPLSKLRKTTDSKGGKKGAGHKRDDAEGTSAQGDASE